MERRGIESRGWGFEGASISEDFTFQPPLLFQSLATKLRHCLPYELKDNFHIAYLLTNLGSLLKAIYLYLLYTVEEIFQLLLHRILEI